MNMSIFVGTDPGYSHCGIVALKTGSDIPVESFKLKYDPTTTEVARHDQWHMIGYEVGEALQDIKRDFSPREAMNIGVLAPIQTKTRGSCLKLHVATGIIYGVCMQYGIATMATDQKVRRTLGPLIGCPLKLKGGAATRFVKQFWPACGNEHLGNAWLSAKYLSITN